MRPEDLLNNLEEGAEWMADNFGVSLADVQSVVAFYEEHQRLLAPTT